MGLIFLSSFLVRKSNPPGEVLVTEKTVFRLIISFPESPKFHLSNFSLNENFHSLFCIPLSLVLQMFLPKSLRMGK